MNGLRQKIGNASSVDEIETLLAEGETYSMASPRTRNKWKTTAEKRKKTLRESK